MDSLEIVDGHLHLDDTRRPVPAGAAVDAVIAEMHAAGITTGFLLHLAWQQWGLDELSEVISERPALIGFANVSPIEQGARGALRRAVEQLGFRGLKLHPRLGGYSPVDERTVDLVRYAGELGIPVVVDAFPDGNWLLRGHGPHHLAQLALAAPGTIVVAAHMGGHQVLDLLMLAKRVPNLWMDFSFSQLYYAGSSVVDDLLYALQSMSCQRVYYGSDHPDRPAGVALQRSLNLVRQAGFSDEQIDLLFRRNAEELIEGTRG